MFFKIDVLKKLYNILKKTPVLGSLLNKVTSIYLKWIFWKQSICLCSVSIILTIKITLDMWMWEPFHNKFGAIVSWENVWTNICQCTKSCKKRTCFSQKKRNCIEKDCIVSTSRMINLLKICFHSTWNNWTLSKISKKKFKKWCRLAGILFAFKKWLSPNFNNSFHYQKTTRDKKITISRFPVEKKPFPLARMEDLLKNMFQLKNKLVRLAANGMEVKWFPLARKSVFIS